MYSDRKVETNIFRKVGNWLFCTYDDLQSSIEQNCGKAQMF